MTPINSIYNSTGVQKSVFQTPKNSNESSTVTNLIVQPNVSFKGTEALAAYNYSLVHKDELFNLPVIKPLDIPTNPNEIQGEKVYNSDGELVRIINENADQKETYYFRNNELHYYLKDEKDSQRKWEMFFDDGKFEGVSKIEPDGTDYSTWYSDGQPSQISKYKYYSDNNSEEMEYLPEYKEYSVSKLYTKNGKTYSSFAHYNDKKECIYASETNNTGKYSDLRFKNGKPYVIETNESKALPLAKDKDDLDLTNLNPSPFYNIDLDKIKSLEGERKYYSNGELEKIITPNGEVYTFEPEGILSTIESPDKEIVFGYTYKTGKITNHNVTEKLPDGSSKKTQYGNTPDEGFDVWYRNGNFSKHACYNEQKNITSYTEFINNESVKSRDYDDDGNLIYFSDEE